METSVNASRPAAGISWARGCLLAAILGIGLAISGILRMIELIAEFFPSGHIVRLVIVALSLGVGAAVFALWAMLTRDALRAIALRWLAALPLPALLALTGLLPAAESQLIALTQFVIALIYAGALTFMIRRPIQWVWAPVTLSTGLIVSLPWFAVGAPGSGLDVALALLTGAPVGWVIGQLLAWRPPLSWQRADLTGGQLVAEGAALSLLLLIVSRALGVNGAPFLFWLTMAASGWWWLAGGRQTPLTASAPTSALAGMVTLGVPLALTDPDALLTMLLFSNGLEGFHLALLAAGGQALLTLLVTPLALFAGNRRLHLAGAGLAVVAAIGLLAGSGRATLAGDRLFVVLRDQADLSDLAAIDDYTARRLAVYQRLTGHAETTQADLRATLDRWGIRFTPYYLVNGFEVEADWPIRLWLQSRPEVAAVMPAPHLRPLPLPLQPSQGSAAQPDETPWNLRLIGAPAVWAQGIRGAGIVIGQADSGVDAEHPELRDAYAGNTANGVAHAYHWLDPWYRTAAPTDISGHGTHTLATALGNTVGVAPDARWIGCVNLARNLGNAPRYLDCMQFLFAPYPPDGDPFRDGDPARGAHVLNNSWGCPQDLEGCTPDSLRPAVQALRAAGVFVVASAGNDGPMCSSLNAPLAIYSDVVTVGAVDSDGRLAIFSSVGPVAVDGSLRVKPDLAAPGVGILSAFPNGSYAQADGTSMAGPHVAGAVALIWSANPALIGDIEATERILRETARPYQHSDGDRCGAGNGVGAGLLDVAAAVARARTWR